MKINTRHITAVIVLILFIASSVSAQTDTLKKPVNISPKIIPNNKIITAPVVISSGVIPANVICVKWDAAGKNNGSSWLNAYTTLQSALAAAVPGKTIWIARGTYKPTTGLDRGANFRLKENVRIIGGFAGTESVETARNWRRNATIIDGDIGMTGNISDNSYNLIYAERVSSATVVDGLFFRNANANRNVAMSLQSAGGAIYIEAAANSNPVFRNCEIADNRATWGAGAAIFDSELIRTLPGGANPLFDSCIFRNNITVRDGGAVLISSLKHSINPRFLNCIFERNRNNDISGGAIFFSNQFARSMPVFEGCVFADNISNGGAAVNFALGSSRAADWSRLGECDPSFTRCTFRYSGGLTISFGQGTIRTATYGRAYTINVRDCIFEYTGSATTTTNLGLSGGAFYNAGNISSQLNLKVTNSIFRKLQVNGFGGVVFNYASLKGKVRNDFTNCLFVQNYGCKGGVLYSSTSGDSTEVVSNFYNSIFYYNYFQISTGCNEGEDILLETAKTSATLINCLTNKTDCNVMSYGAGRTTCTNSLYAADPLFVDFTGGNYNLRAGSPAIDAGNNIYIATVPLDLRGNTRRLGAQVDIGPYEFVR